MLYHTVGTDKREKNALEMQNSDLINIKLQTRTEVQMCVRVKL